MRSKTIVPDFGYKLSSYRGGMKEKLGLVNASHFLFQITPSPIYVDRTEKEMRRESKAVNSV